MYSDVAAQNMGFQVIVMLFYAFGLGTWNYTTAGHTTRSHAVGVFIFL